MSSRGSRFPKDVTRSQRMADLYRDGKTLQEIGDLHGVTRERVRQLISFFGLTRYRSGRYLANAGARLGDARERRARFLAKEEARYLRVLGCSRDVFFELTGQEWNWGIHRAGSATNHPGIAYANQQRTARDRGIDWELTFPEWWRIWRESGKWEKRGRGNGYCMARYGDSGPYAASNVYICTIGQNFSDSYLVHPWSERFPDGFPVKQKAAA